MINRRTFIAVAAAAAMSALTPVNFATAQEKVVVGVVTVAPPFSYSEGGKMTGISNDILQRVAEIENFTIDYVPLKFDALIPSIQAGQIDIAVSGIFVTEERKKVVDFSDPYHLQGAVLVAPVDSSINGIQELRGKTIAAEQGSAALNIANAEAENWGVTIRILQDAANMQLAMRTGDVDAMIYDSGIVAYQVRVEGDKPTIKTISETINPTGIAFAFPKASKWIEVVNRGMATMTADGEIEAIKAKYDMN